MNSRIEALEAENEALHAKLKAWTSSSEVADYRSVFGLSKQEARVLSLLCQRVRVSNEQIYIAVFEHLNGEGPEPVIIKVIIHKIRKKLKAKGLPVTIETVWGEGYKIQPETKQAIERAVAPLCAAA